MKILVLVDSYPNKDNPTANIFAHLQAKALKKAGYDVDVMYIDVRSIRRKRKWGYKEYENDGIKVYRYALPCGPIKWLARLLSKFSCKKCYKKYIKNNGKPDIIHAHFYTAGYCAYVLKKKFNQDYIITEHSSLFLTGKITAKEEKSAVKIYNDAKKVFAVSNMLKGKIQQYCQKEIEVFPNILPSYFKINEQNKSEIFTFVSIGNLVKDKRIDLVIKAFNIFYKQNTNSKLIIFGDGVLKEELRKLIKDLNINNVVELRGRIPNNEIVEQYNKANVFVLPSAYETFGVVYMEAMACGLPVIATKCGGPEDFVNETNGILLPLNISEDDLAKAMIEMFNNYDKYNSKDISKDTITKFGEESFVNRISKELTK